MATFKVVVVGGGLSGALLANGLLNNGVDVTVYERDAADSKREGYQIRLGDAAMQGFKACLTKDCLSTILRKFGQSTLAASTAPTIMTTKFKPILDLTQSVSYSKSSAINRVALRNILLEPIKAAGRVRFDKSLVRYEIVHKGTDSEAVMVYFSDGSTHKCHVLIGADGSGSKVMIRRFILPSLFTCHTSVVSSADALTNTKRHYRLMCNLAPKTLSTSTATWQS